MSEVFTAEQLRDNPGLAKALVTGFPVNEDALGDMNQDGMMNILDLIRMRDIYRGIGGGASAYELLEGDLNQDGIINQRDILEIRDILVWKAGIPYLIGSSGGEMSDRGIEVTIPAGALDTTKVFRVTKLSSNYFEEKYGIDISQEEVDSNYVMSGFRFESSEPVDFSKSAGLTIHLASLPPCSFRGLNALYEISPDADGDGRAEIAYSGLMVPMADSMSLQLQIGQNPVLEGIVPSAYGVLPETPARQGDHITLFVGQLIRLNGSGIDERCCIHFIDPASNMETALRVNRDTIGSYSFVPAHPTAPEVGGSVEVIIENLETGLRSQALPASDVTIVWNPQQQTNPDSIITDYCLSLSEFLVQTRDSLLVDETWAAEDRDLLLHDAEMALASLPTVQDSLLNLSLEKRNRLATAIVMSGSGSIGASSRVAASQSEEEDCWTKCRDEFFKEARLTMICYLGVGWIPLFCEYMDIVHVYKISKCFNSEYECVDPCPGGVFFQPDSDKDHFCPNIFTHWGKVCIGETWTAFPGPGHPYHGEYLLPRVLSTSKNSSACCVAASPYHPLKGAIVHANKRLPFGAVGRINGAGGFELPGIPPNSTITIGIYDPKTGLSDLDVGNFSTGNDYNRNKIYRPFLFYNPDTSSYDFPLQMGHPLSGTISSIMPRIVYHLSLTPGNSARIKFWSEQPLTFWVQDESGNFVAKDSLSASPVVAIQQPGKYRITVTSGLFGGKGDFELGADYFPFYPITRIVGKVSGVLAAEKSPYHMLGDIVVPSGDSIVAEPGAAVFVDASASLTDGGSIRLDSLVVTPTGVLSHKAGLAAGITIFANELLVESGGKIDVSGRGYGRAQTYPGEVTPTIGSGGSHGGYGGHGDSGCRLGSVYGLVDDPVELGSGGANNQASAGKAGGGLIRLVVDRLELNGGSLIANGENEGNPNNSGSGGGAGGSINIRAREVSGTGNVQAWGGRGGAGAGGGGRIAVRWQEGSIGGWTLVAKGGQGDTQHGGSGTIYLLGPDDGVDGRLIVDNGTRAGAETPLLEDRTQFEGMKVLGAAKLTVGAAVDEADVLTVLDSVLVSGANSQLMMKDSSSVSTPRLVGRSGGVVTFGKAVEIAVPQMWMDGGAGVVTATDLTFADALDFRMTGGGYVENQREATFTIPRFETDNMVAGTFYNWGKLRVLSDSLVIGSGVTLEENGLLGDVDSVLSMRVLGTVTHAEWASWSKDSQLDTGLVFTAGDLVVESTAKIDVSGKGYGAQQTYPGHTASVSGAGGSHGGMGGYDKDGGAPGDVYGLDTDPREFGGGGGNRGSGKGAKGGGIVCLSIGRLFLNGCSILANGGPRWSDFLAGGGAGGSINIRASSVSGSGIVRANGSAGGGDRGGGGGGRIAVRWQSGDLLGWSLSANGGSGYHTGSPGTVDTMRVTVPLGAAR